VSKNIDDTFTLTYNDNGLGVPLTLLNGHVTTFGMYLIDTLVSQIEGRIEMNTESGPFYKINFRGCNYQVKFHVSEHPSDGKSIYR
jgi:two-component sensor histidine kinase